MNVFILNAQTYQDCLNRFFDSLLDMEANDFVSHYFNIPDFSHQSPIMLRFLKQKPGKLLLTDLTALSHTGLSLPEMLDRAPILEYPNIDRQRTAL